MFQQVSPIHTTSVMLTIEFCLSYAVNGLEKSGACTTFVAAIANLFSKNIWFLEVTFLSRTALYIFVDTILQEMAFGLKESFKHRNVCISLVTLY